MTYQLSPRRDKEDQEKSRKPKSKEKMSLRNLKQEMEERNEKIMEMKEKAKKKIVKVHVVMMKDNQDGTKLQRLGVKTVHMQNGEVVEFIQAVDKKILMYMLDKELENFSIKDL